MSKELSLQNIIISCLQSSVAAAISSLPILARDEDTELPDDCITVRVDPAVPSMPAFRESEPPKFWQAVVTIEATWTTRTAANMDAIMAAIDAVMILTAAPNATIAAAALAAFPNGLWIDAQTGGENNPEGVLSREGARMYLARWGHV